MTARTTTTVRPTTPAMAEATVGTPMAIVVETAGTDPRGWVQNREHPSDYRFISCRQQSTIREATRRRCEARRRRFRPGDGVWRLGCEIAAYGPSCASVRVV